MFVYGNWSAYDELSDGVILTEDLAMAQMDQVSRFKRLGVRFDCYLMDAFWYDPEGSYRIWRRSTWPDGPARWFERCEREGLLPGLWFTANTLFHMSLPPKWKNSLDRAEWGLCCFEGGFLDDFMEVLDDWYACGVRVFKLDFAEFFAVPKGREQRWSREEARERNVHAYRSALSAFRKSHPDCLFLGFNGFDHRECMDRSDHSPGEYIDPGWLEVFDSLYSGDPRPSDLPGQFWRSVDVYADCMTRLFESSGIGLERIDNCGFMAGPTGTCYWRGKANWQESLLLSYARGGKIHVAYGDLEAFSDEDVDWWASAQRLFLPFLEAGKTSSQGGWPGRGEGYGWKSEVATDALLTLVNPGLEECSFALDSRDWQCVASNQSRPLEHGVLKLGAGGLAILGSSHQLPRLTLPPWDQAIDRGLSLSNSSGPGPHLSASSEPVSGRFTVVVTQRDLEGQALRTFPTESAEFPIQVEIVDDSGICKLPSMFDKKIWSGISWSLLEFEAQNLVEVRVQTLETRPCELEIKLFTRSSNPAA